MIIGNKADMGNRNFSLNTHLGAVQNVLDVGFFFFFTFNSRVHSGQCPPKRLKVDIGLVFVLKPNEQWSVDIDRPPVIMAMTSERGKLQKKKDEKDGRKKEKNEGEKKMVKFWEVS